MEIKRAEILTLSFVVVTLFFFLKRKKKQVKTDNKTDSVSAKFIDDISVQRLNILHPDIRTDALNAISEVNKKTGLNLQITSTLRTINEQAKLYNQGRSAPGKIVTNAKPGYSYHNYGLAFDVVPMMGKIADYSDINKFRKAAQIIKNYGFQWGGDWSSFKDYPHFQRSYNIPAIHFHNFVSKNNNYPDIEKAKKALK